MDLRRYFGGKVETAVPGPSQRLRLSGKGLRIPLQGVPFAVEMGQQRLHLYPDFGLKEPSQTSSPDFLLVDPERYFSRIGHFLRLRPHERFSTSADDENQKHLFGTPREAFRRHLQISHEGDALVFKDPISELGTYVSLLRDEEETTRLSAARRFALERVIEIFGGPVEALASGVALDTVKRVNDLLREEPYRQLDLEGNPGGLLELPANLTPVLVGDLHGQTDNLLKILSENAFMQSLDKGEAVLVILGDAAHSDDPQNLESMDPSVLLMDLIFKLKLAFPNQVFFLIGNHDSFSHEVMKGGVPQGVVWAKHLTALRGESYRSEVALFYQLAPVVALSENFLACHAGPPRIKVSRDVLVEMRQDPGLVHDLTWTRVKTPGFPGGYRRGDVRRFRKGLGLEENTPFIVGHYPLSSDATIWQDIGGISKHHIVYSSMDDRVGVFTQIDDDIVPQVYPAEHLVEWVNERARSVAAG